MRLRELMTFQRYKLLGCFLHDMVTPVEEINMGENQLRKLAPLMEQFKAKCIEYYQPLQQLSVDERMVKSKPRCHMMGFQSVGGGRHQWLHN